MRTLALGLIRFYQKHLAWLNGSSVCRFEPSCSEYSYQAIAKYGILRGAWLGGKRIVKCNPLFPAGLDPLT